MKRVVLFLLVASLICGTTGFAQTFKQSGDQAQMLGLGIEVNTAKGGKLKVAVGGEKIFLNEGKTSVSFKKDADHKFPTTLYYSCLACDKHQVKPGTCKCGQALVPSFKHGDTWHLLSRDVDGNLVIDGQAAPAPMATPAVCPCGTPECKGECQSKVCPCGTPACKGQCQSMKCDPAKCKSMGKCKGMAKCKGMMKCDPAKCGDKCTGNCQGKPAPQVCPAACCKDAPQACNPDGTCPAGCCKDAKPATCAPGMTCSPDGTCTPAPSGH